MIENNLFMPVKNVKKQTLLGFLCVVLIGCDNGKELVSFTPEMASFSNEFEFDPLRGPVKDFSQTLLNENGEVAKRVRGTLSQEGCFDTLELHDTESNSGMALVLDANYYLDAETLEKRSVYRGNASWRNYLLPGWCGTPTITASLFQEQGKKCRCSTGTTRRAIRWEKPPSVKTTRYVLMRNRQPIR